MTPDPPARPELPIADPDLWPGCLPPGTDGWYLPAVDWRARHRELDPHRAPKP